VEHASFGGRMRIRLVVDHELDFWSGFLEWGESLGPREHVQVQLLDDMRLEINCTTGRERMLLTGKATAHGVLHGEVVADGASGGVFSLWPSERSRFSRMLQEWYIAFRSGPCLEALPHGTCEDLPPECSVCLEAFMPGDFFVRTQCLEPGHVFHRNCIFTWLRTSTKCPLCRRALIHPLMTMEGVLLEDGVYDMSTFMSHQMWRAEP